MSQNAFEKKWGGSRMSDFELVMRQDTLETQKRYHMIIAKKI